MHRGNPYARTANSKKLLPNRMRESHHPRERIQCPDQFQAPREQHPPQSEVPHLNRLPVPAETSYVHLFWDICPDSPNTNCDTCHRRSACQGQSHQSSQRQQSLPTSDNADASDITRDGNQHSFYQVNHSLYMCCRSLQMLCPN